MNATQSGGAAQVSRQRSLEQRRAAAAWRCIEQVKSQSYRGKYGPLARGAPTDIQVSGLGQSLAFWRSKGKRDTGLPTNEYQALVRDVSDWVVSQVNVPPDQPLFVWIMETATTDEYRRATAEALAFLGWVKRFAEAELSDGGTNQRDEAHA